MKYLVLFLFSTHVQAAEIPAGTWQLSDAFCTNPNYVQSPDEKAFVDAIKSGYTVDQYVLTTPTQGQFTTTFNETRASCTGTSEVSLKYLDEDNVEISFSGTKWVSASTDPNTSINCTGDENPFVSTAQFEVQGLNLFFIYPAGTDCGEFRFQWTLKP